MAGLGDAIKYLYEKFILRDILSFITPGAIVIGTALLLFSPEWRQIFKFIHTYWPLYFLLFSIFYMVGVAVQCLGEFIGIVHFHPQYRSNWRLRWNIFWPNWYNNTDGWWRLIHDETVAFTRYTQTHQKEWGLLLDERFIVLRQMCANGFLAIAFAAILLIISYIPWLWFKLVLVIILVALPLLASLFWGHRVHVLRQFDWRRAVQEQRLQ